MSERVWVLGPVKVSVTGHRGAGRVGERLQARHLSCPVLLGPSVAFTGLAAARSRGEYTMESMLLAAPLQRVDEERSPATGRAGDGQRQPLVGKQGVDGGVAWRWQRRAKFEHFPSDTRCTVPALAAVKLIS